MFTTEIYRTAVVARWVARIMGTLMALFFLAFVAGEGPPPLFRLSLQQNLHFLAMAALFVGLLLAWKWELPGGLIPLAGFVLLLRIEGVRPLAGALFLLPAGVAVLNLVCWWGLRAGAPAGGAAWQAPKPALLAAGVCAGVFVALCANEMFLNPPLMTAAFRPPAAITGEWRATLTAARADAASSALEVVFVIHPDGSVTGQVGDAALTSGRMENNRSWFGSLMNWREEYAMRGSLSHAIQASKDVSSDRFAAPLTSSGQELRGALFLANYPLRMTLTKQ